MKKGWWCLLFLAQFIVYDGISQLDSVGVAKNALYVEAGGTGGYGSMNYEKLITSQNHLRIVGRIGVGTYNILDFQNRLNPDVLFPIGINGVYGKSHSLEIGVGQTISTLVKVDQTDYLKRRKTSFHASFNIGYRYQPKKGGFLFRCSYTPIIENYNYYRHWGSVSFGYAF